MILDINHKEKKKTAKKHKYVELEQYATQQPTVTEEIKEEIKKRLETNENGNTMI